MGLCCWLRQAPTGEIDLDSLLAVELPAMQTPDSTTQLITTTVVRCPKKRGDGRDTVALDCVRENALVVYLTPILDERVSEYFESAENLAAFIAQSKDQAENQSTYIADARKMLDANSDAKVRELVHSKNDLKALAEYAAGRVEPPKPSEVVRLEALVDEVTRLKSLLDTDSSAIDALERRLRALKQQMDRSVDDHNALVDTYNAVVVELNTRSSRHDSLVERHNSLVETVKRERQDYATRSVVEIGGGIDMSPGKFKVQPAPDSPLLRRLDRVAEGLVETGTPGDSAWLRLRCDSHRDIPVRRLPLDPIEIVERSEHEGRVVARAESPACRRWMAREGKSGVWRDQETRQDGTTTAKYYDPATGSLHVAFFREGQQKSYRIATRQGPDQIIFRQGKTQILTPEEPPAWWRDTPKPSTNLPAGPKG